VKEGKITSIEEIFLYSLPVKEAEIIDYLLKDKKLQDEVMKIMPVQKQSSAGQRTRFKSFVALGDSDGHIGLGSKCASEVCFNVSPIVLPHRMNLLI
jgi:small subunit ribosomal protein S2e